MARMKTNRPLKDCFIGIKCDKQTKEALVSMAESRGMTVSSLIFRLIASGISMERQRREQIGLIMKEV